MKNLFTLIAGLLFYFSNAQDGTLHTGFDPGNAFAMGNNVMLVREQADGKILVGGAINYFNSTPTSRILRLTQSGDLDIPFNNNVLALGITNYVTDLEIQSDNKIIIVGGFLTSYGAPSNGILRLNSDGTLDTSFNIGLGSSAGSLINSIAVQPDGKFIIGGIFNSFNGVNAKGLIRLNSDGTVDPSFSISNGFESHLGYNIYDVVIQPDGKILVGGMFTVFNETVVGNIIRLNSDGSMDYTFNQGVGFNSSVTKMIVQQDGKILASGNFSQYNGTSYNQLIRLNSNGSVDNSFAPVSFSGGFGPILSKIALQDDQKILVSGRFTTFNGQAKNNLVRLLPNGSIDCTFQNLTYTGFSGGDSAVGGCEILSNKIAVFGGFSAVQGAVRGQIALLNYNTTVANDDSFTTPVGTAYTSTSVLANDLVYNVPATLSNAVLVQTSPFLIPGINFNTSTGIVTVAATTAPGIYSIDYKLCSNNPECPDCKTANITIKVVAPITIVANPDYFSECISGTDGGVSTSITTNDTMNGQPINSSLVTVTLNDTAGLVGLSVSSSGVITIPVGTPSGVYIIHYTIKETANPTNSASSTVTLCINKSINRGSGTNGTVFGLARQADGKIIIVGKFSTYDGVTRNCIARLNADLSLDTGFDAGGIGFIGTAHAVAIDSNGTIFVGGDFINTSTGLSVKCLAKLKQTSSPFTNGTVDTTFINNNFSIDGYMPVIYSIAIDTDNNIYVGGRFNKIGNLDKKNYAKLNNAGVVFPNYTSAITANDGVVNSIALNGQKLIIGGSYQIGLNSHYLTQLLTDGTLDTSFNHAVGANGTIYSVLVNGNNIFAAGKFDSYNGTTIKNIVKLNSNGNLVHPLLFNPGLSSNNIIRDVKLLGTRIIVVGDFTQFGSEQRNHIAALNPNGSVYTAFNPGSGASNPILAAIVQPDQKIIIGGSFNEYNETIVNYITRILSTNAGITGRYATGTLEDEDGKDIIPFASEVTFYPNPATSTINIIPGTFSDEIFKIQIFNMLGQEVYTSKTLKGDNSSINISNLQSGSYFMILSNDKRSFKKTFIKE